MKSVEVSICYIEFAIFGALFLLFGIWGHFFEILIVVWKKKDGGK